MESSTYYKPYTAPCIEVVEIVLESKVLQPSSVSISNSNISDLDEDNDEFIW